MLNGHITIHKLLASMGRLGASDLHIKAGLPPTYRVGGHLRPIDSEPLSDDDADHLLDPILSDVQKRRYEEDNNLDFAWRLPDGDRFRINVFRSGAHTHAAIRRVQASIPTYDELHLPPIYREIIENSFEGLVLVVGVTGSGKSSTLAAMVDQVNATRDVNIITIEDPVEYRFSPRKAIVSQREIGIDVASFPEAMRYVVRQDPDVIFVGELRDHETILAAIQAAETGHLVFGTLHTADTMGAFSRMLEFFPQEEREFIRSSLSGSLRAICAQRLLPAAPDFEVKVVPATEVLIATPIVEEKIREAEDHDLPAIVGSSSGDGMHNFTRSLADLVEKEWVSIQTARDAAPNREALDAILKGLQVQASTLVNRIKG